MLNDWASAVDLNTAHPFWGAIEFAANDVLLLASKNKPVVGLPRHDLEMLAKVIFSRLYLVDWLSFPSARDPENVAGLVARWERIFGLPVWSELRSAATAADYERMKKAIRSLFLPRPSP